MLFFRLKKRVLVIVAILLTWIGIELWGFFFSDEEKQTVAPQVVKEKKDYRVLQVSEIGAIQNLDSAMSLDPTSINILNNVQEGLMRMGKKNQIVNGIASDYKISPDYQTYTFTLRKEAKWNDGQPVTAEDFAYAWKRVLDPDTKSPHARLFFLIQNAEDYHLGKVEADEIGIDVVNEHTLQVRLNRPSPQFLSLVTLTPFLPQKKETVEKFGDKYATQASFMSYNGPFQIQTVNPSHAVLIKNEQYWDQKQVRLQKVEVDVVKNENEPFDLFQSELTDITSLPEDTIKHEKVEYTSVPEAGIQYLVFNQKNSFLQNENIRKAITHAINRKSITQQLNDGSEPAIALVPPSIQWVGGKTFRQLAGKGESLYDPDQAKQYLSKGLTELNLKETPKLTLIGYDDAKRKQVAQMIKEQLYETLELQVEIKNLSIKEKKRIEDNGEFDLSFKGWPAEYHNPFTFLEIWHSASELNKGSFQNSTFDELLEQASKEIDPSKQVQKLIQAEKVLLQDEAVVAPLYFASDLRLQQPYVKNVYYHPFGPKYTLKWAHLENPDGKKSP